MRGIGATSSDMGGQGGNLADGDEVESDEQAADSPFDVTSGGVSEVLSTMNDQLGNMGSSIQLLPTEYVALIIAALLIILFALPYVIKKLQRRIRYRRMFADGAQEGALKLYRLFLKQFRVLKLARQDAVSLTEYAMQQASSFRRFEAPSSDVLCTAGGDRSSAFEGITESYTRAVYGDEELCEDEMQAFQRYHDSFYRNAVRYVGRLRYLITFFRI